MGKLGVFEGRNSGSESDCIRSDKYLELSLQGKWIAVARSWLEDNCPCSIDKYYQCVSQLMPTHIAMCRANSFPQLMLCRKALVRLSSVYRCKNGEPVIAVVDDTITITRKRNETKYDYSWIPSQFENGLQLDLGQLQMNSKQKRAAAAYLRRCGFKSLGKWVYQYEQLERSD